MPHFDQSFRTALHQLISLRRDVRRFRTDPLPQSLLDELLQTACEAPSVGFSQPWRWITVDDPARRAAIITNFRACNERALQEYEGEKAALYARLKLAGLQEAPVHLAVCVDPVTQTGSGLGTRTMPEMLHYSTVCAIQTLWLMARAHGVGVGWVSILDPAEILRILDAPPTWQLVAYLCIGYPEAELAQPELETAGWEKRCRLEEVRLAR